VKDVDGALKGCAPSVRYAVRRLVRGLGSAREVELRTHSFTESPRLSLASLCVSVCLCVSLSVPLTYAVLRYAATRLERLQS
jgi:hypothetical protein